MNNEFKIERKRGDTFPLAFSATDRYSNAIDITGYSFLFSVSISQAPTGATYVVQLTGVITDAANGKFEFQPSAPEMDITPGLYYYDIQITDALGKTKTPILNEFEITQDITKN